MTEHLGEQKPRLGSRAWWLIWPAPRGGDTDQIKAVASGECDIGVTNSYYLARMMRSNKPEDVAVVNKVGVVFPNQAPRGGTHLNIAGVQSPNTLKQGKRRQVPRIPKPRSPKPLLPTATTSGQRSRA